ncbi:MAG TPA: hypothetical protein VF950_26025 [Planctomycetota bacterium]
MSVFDFIVMLVIAGLLGWLVSRLLGLHNAGLLFMTFFGFLGLLLGRFLVHKLGFWEPVNVAVDLAGGYVRVPLMWSVIGGLTTTLFAGYLARRRRRAREKRK